MSTPLRYELAWNYIWDNYSDWKKQTVTEKPNGRHATEFAQAVVSLAESNKKIPVVKTNRVVQAKPKLQPSGIK